MIRRILTALTLCIAFCSIGFAQGVRVGPANVTEASGASPNVVELPANPVISFCNAPANAVPCTNKATTYTDATLGTPCATSTQIVLDGTSTCVSLPDANNNWGVWVAAGQYAYTITVGGLNLGPYYVTAGAASGSGSVSSVGLSLPSAFTVTNSPVTSSGTLTGAFNVVDQNYLITSIASNSAAWEQINGGASCGDGTHAINFTASTHLFGCQSVTGSVTWPLTSTTSNPATAGQGRFAKTDTWDWRNNANSANLPLGINGSDLLTFNSNILCPQGTSTTQVLFNLSGNCTGSPYLTWDNTNQQLYVASGSPSTPTFTSTAIYANNLYSGSILANSNAISVLMTCNQNLAAPGACDGTNTTLTLNNPTSGTGIIDKSYGIYSAVTANGPGNVGDFHNIFLNGQINGGTVGGYSGMRVFPPTQTGGSIGVVYGITLDGFTQSGGTITASLDGLAINDYSTTNAPFSAAIYTAAQTNATGSNPNWNFYSLGGKSYHAGDFFFGADVAPNVVSTSNLGKATLPWKSLFIGPANGQYINLLGTNVTGTRTVQAPDIGGTLGIVTGSTPTNGDCAKFVVSGSVISLATSGVNPCGGSGGSVSLDSVTAAVAPNTISSGDNDQVWRWLQTTNSTNAFTVTESAASAATTPTLFNIHTLSTSTAFPFVATAGGTTNGIHLTTAGLLAAVGTGGINATQYKGGTASGTGACSAHNWASTLNDAAAPTCTQPAFTDITGSIALAQTQLTTAGDLWFANNSPALARLAVGSNGQCLIVSSLLPAWAACPGGVSAVGTPSAGTYAQWVTATSIQGVAGVGGGASPLTGTFGSFVQGQFPCGDATPKLINCTAGIVVNSQSGTSYTFLGGAGGTSDRNKLVVRSASSTMTDTLPQANSTGFDSNYPTCVQNTGTANDTITPTTSTVNGNATLVVPAGSSACLDSDNTNYFARVIPKLATPSTVAFLSAPVTVAVLDQTGVSSANSGSPQTVYTVPASQGGTYVLGLYVDESAGCGTIGSAALTIGTGWTDATHARVIPTAGPTAAFTPNTSAAGTDLYGGNQIAPFVLYAAAGSSITVTTTYTACGAGTWTYDLHAYVERIN